MRRLVAQRLFGLVLGYEDLNDHDKLRDDSLLALAVERDDLTGENRVCDRGHPLASEPAGRARRALPCHHITCSGRNRGWNRPDFFRQILVCLTVRDRNNLARFWPGGGLAVTVAGHDDKHCSFERPGLRRSRQFRRVDDEQVREQDFGGIASFAPTGRAMR